MEDIKELKDNKKMCVNFFIGVISIICSWVFIYKIWEITGREISHRILSKLLEVMALIVGICFVRVHKFKREEIGLGTKKIGSILLKNVIFSVIVIGIMIVLKLVLIKSNFELFDKNEALWNWNVMSWARWIYPITVLMQEFVINGIMQESLDKILEGKYKIFGIIMLSAFYFGALHIHKGFGYMIGASVMSMFLCVVYRKQRTIWGIALSHYLLGMAAKFLGYI